MLWAAGRAYYYRGGEKIAIAHGGGFYEDVDLEILTEIRDIEPVNLDEVLEKNIDKIHFYTHDSMNFIRSTVEKYKDKVDIVTVSFSGGKDSVVVADLVKRTLNSTNFVVIFADTQLESKMTYDFVDQFHHENPKIQVLKARLGRDQTELWGGKLGPPSRINRWCHTVYKTAPIRKTIKEYLGGQEKPTVLLIDGIRAEESARRSKYDNIQFGTKEMLQINVSPILEWSSLEVFLYMFLRKLSFNQMYRWGGYSRVGCIICPYSSSWGGEYLSRRLFEEDVEPYLTIIKQNVESSHIPDINNYISEGGRWKSRSGGLDLDYGGNRAEFIVDDGNLTIITDRDSPNFWTWLKNIGTYSQA
ncbi:phosphoadenosine phosphosulfate reductase family protein [Methanoculleus chikugoensis]|uniref:phosphoadenosine phosphosulfate reductase domain-containing protein n=1 Tax=Methanoculleus chikugoensis TaxID=118126 RepID=UPI000AD52AE9|nr:phosphoadenosine phosphosulfate reductase family protein [Methanoculleus chikugoensis]